MRAHYQHGTNPEFHVWDLGDYGSPANSACAYAAGWMKRCLSPGDAVMDIGCGAGYGVKVLHDSGHKVLGVDLNDVLVAKARSQGLNVLKLDALEAIQRYGPDYNVFCLSDFIEHVPLQVVWEIFGVLAARPGVKIYFCTPNLDSLMGFKFWFHMPTHVNAMHPFVLRGMLRRLNFTVIEEWSEYGNLPGRGWKLRLRKWLLCKLVGPTQAQLFYGGANICYWVSSSAASVSPS